VSARFRVLHTSTSTISGAGVEERTTAGRQPSCGAAHFDSYRCAWIVCTAALVPRYSRPPASASTSKCCLVWILDKRPSKVFCDGGGLADVRHRLRIRRAFAPHNLDEQRGRFADAGEDAVQRWGDPEPMEDVTHAATLVSVAWVTPVTTAVSVGPMMPIPDALLWRSATR